jgi:hypothetical protein
MAEFAGTSVPYDPGGPSTNVHSGGGGQQLIGYRDILDARRAMATGRTPQAAYPDGYLGNVSSRREDRLLKGVQSRLTQRSFQRGIHKGERIDPSDYFWNDQVNPGIALEYQAQGKKWTQTGYTPAEQLTHMGKVDFATPQEMNAFYRSYGVHPPEPEKGINPIRAEKMARLLPGYSS